MSTCNRLDLEVHIRILTDYAQNSPRDIRLKVGVWSLLFIGHIASLFEWLGIMQC